MREELEGGTGAGGWESIPSKKVACILFSEELEEKAWHVHPQYE